MSRRARTALQVTIALAPAVVLAVALALWGDRLGAVVTDAFNRRSVRVEGATHTYLLPERSWGDKIPPFVDKFLERFPQDQPFRGSLKPLTQALTLQILSDTEEFKRVAYGETGDTLPFNGGYFLEQKAKILIDAEGASPDSLGAALSHELTHAIMRYSFASKPPWSPWVSEGFAQWCEISTAEAKIGTQRNTSRLKRSRLSVQKDSLTRLLQAKNSNFSGRGNDWYYDASYALVTFLLEDFREDFIRYFELEAQSRLVDSATDFNRIFVDIPSIERRWLEWLQQWK